MTSGSFAAACVSASTKVAGVGSAGVVGVTGSPTAEATCASTGGLSTFSIWRESLTSFCSDVMMLPLAIPVAASLTSSKLFLRSAISASRIASWNWPWNSPAILRALPIHCPTMRSTPGSSFGPMAISATTAMTTSSLHPMSNMKVSAHARISPHPSSRDLRAPAPFLNDVAFSSEVGTGSRQENASKKALDSLAANVGTGRRRRRIVVDGLRRLGRLFRRLFVFLHALLERLDAGSDVAHQVRNLATAEQQQDHHDHDEPVPNTKRTHPATLQKRGATVPAQALGGR